MAVKRIVMNIATDRIDAGRTFYAEVLGLDVVMDHGRITTFVAVGASATTALQGNPGA